MESTKMLEGWYTYKHTHTHTHTHTQAQLLCQLPSQCSDGVEGEEEGDRTAANVAMLADDSAYLGFFFDHYVFSPYFFYDKYLNSFIYAVFLC